MRAPKVLGVASGALVVAGALGWLLLECVARVFYPIGSALELHAAAVSLPVGAALTWQLLGDGRQRLRTAAVTFPVWCVAAWWTISTAMRLANGAFDRGPAEAHEVDVIERRLASPAFWMPELRVVSWRAEERAVVVPVGRRLFLGPPGRVRVTVRPGALGYLWVAGVEATEPLRTGRRPLLDSAEGAAR